MAIQLNDGLQTNAPRAVDMRSGKLVAGKTVPFANVAEALAAIDVAYRFEGLECLVKEDDVIKKYRFNADYAEDGIEEVLPGTPISFNNGAGIVVTDEGEGNFTVQAGGDIPNTKSVGFNLVSGFGLPAGKFEIDNGEIESSNICRVIASVHGADDSKAELVVSANRATGDQTQINLTVEDADEGPAVTSYIKVNGRSGIEMGQGSGNPLMNLGGDGATMSVNNDSGGYAVIEMNGGGSGYAALKGSTTGIDEASVQCQGSAVVIESPGFLYLNSIVALDFANDAAAEAEGVPVGGVYHNAGVLRIRIS